MEASLVGFIPLK